MRTPRILAIITLTILVATGCSWDRFRHLQRYDVESNGQSFENPPATARRIRPFQRGWLQAKLSRQTLLGSTSESSLICPTCNSAVDVLYDGQCNACAQNSYSNEIAPLNDAVDGDATAPDGEYLDVEAEEENDASTPEESGTPSADKGWDSPGESGDIRGHSKTRSFEDYNINAERQRIAEILDAAKKAKERSVLQENDIVQDDPAPTIGSGANGSETNSNEVLPSGDNQLLDEVPKDPAEQSRPEQQVVSELQNVLVPHRVIHDSSTVIPQQFHRPASSQRDGLIVLKARPVENVNFNSQQQFAQKTLEIAPPRELPVTNLRAVRTPTQRREDLPALNAMYDNVQQALQLPSYTFRPLPEINEVTRSPEGIPLERIPIETNDDLTSSSQPPVDHNPPVLLGGPSLPATNGAVEILRLRDSGKWVVEIQKRKFFGSD